MTTKTKQKKTLERILLINDDVDDIAAMRARFPENIEVEVASQFQARNIVWNKENDSGNAGNCNHYDVVILDNDANNLNESKGVETLEAIRKANPDVPIIYTSFQPGAVAASVSQERNVSLVRTDEALDVLASRYNVRLKKAERKKVDKPLLHILLTYNTVSNYTPGLYTAANGEKMLVVSYDRHATDKAKEVLTAEVRKIYSDFDWRTDRDLIKNVFVYDGINGGDLPGRAAVCLGHDTRMRVNLLACDCNWKKKAELANNTYVDLFQVECGGDRSMGVVADMIMGVKRPGIDYSKSPVPAEVIRKGVEKFRI